VSRAFPRQADLVLQGTSADAAVDLFAPDAHARLRALTGHFGLVAQRGREVALARDALGVNKLFFAIHRGELRTSSFFLDLVSQGIAPEHVWSVPSGHLLRFDLDGGRFELSKWSTLEPAAHATDEMEGLADGVRQRLGAVFRGLARTLGKRPLFVSMSGGLDSTTIAVLAREHLGPFTGVTFAVDDGKLRDGLRDDDLRAAERVASELGVAHRTVIVSPDTLAEHLDDALVYGQDYRDFNVHCALVNAVLGAAIGGSADDAVVLTGDTMNELVADYSPVQFEGRAHYVLPDLSPGRLRRYLVQGLDSGDREVGVLARWGVQTVQPFALAADAYVALPDAMVHEAGSKQRFVRSVFGDRIPEFVYARPKVRAQVGAAGEPSGTMAVLLRLGVDQSVLERRFEALFGMDARERRRLIRAGMYRFPTEHPRGTS
jgi:asparagine synthetase B (glutamine-hydrolysing)